MNALDQPLISVVVTVFNKVDRLPATLKSLRGQPGPRAEIVCVDDASSDGSLDLLRVAAMHDPMLRVVANSDNRGPAIRLNQGAETARGRWLHLIDGDDLAAPNAHAWMLEQLQSLRAPLIYGRRRQARQPEPIPADAPVERVGGPLAFCAGRPVTHMALMVERRLFLAAGGADPEVFIQDQSLPLRLAAKADVMLWTDATVCFAPPREVSSLSANRVQQNHDRFVGALNVLETLHDGRDGVAELRGLATAALFKLERETGRRRPGTAVAYFRAKLGFPPGRAWLAAQRQRVAAVAGVRRMPLPMDRDAN